MSTPDGRPPAVWLARALEHVKASPPVLKASHGACMRMRNITRDGSSVAVSYGTLNGWVKPAARERGLADAKRILEERYALLRFYSGNGQ